MSKIIKLPRTFFNPVFSTIIKGDAVSTLSLLPDESINCVITSPPYWGMRCYNHKYAIGSESTLSEYLDKLVVVFIEIKRVLRKDGILWLNVADGYTSGNRASRAPDKKNPKRAMKTRPANPDGLKGKNLLGIPFKLAFMLQQNGWHLRSDIVWNKPNAQPESVRDRPTKVHEYLFMLTKSQKYTYYRDQGLEESNGKLRNRRTVWNINTKPDKRLSHPAPFPESLITPCIAVSTLEFDFVLDPFFGSGTVGRVAQRMNRRFVGIELIPEYAEIAAERNRIPKNRIIELKEETIKFTIDSQ